MTFLGRTRAVISKLGKDIDKIIFWVTIVIQVFFLFFYGYSIYTNLSNIIFLIIYSLLGLVSVFNLVYVIVTHPYKKKAEVKKVKFFARIFKYLINGTMIGVNLFEIIKFGGSDFNKIMIIVSFVSLGIQICLEIIRKIISYYAELFITSIQMDLGFVFKLAKMKETKGTFYEILDMPLEAIANKIEGKEPELSETENYLNELLAEYETENKKKIKNNSNQTVEKQKKEIVEHLNIIKNKLFGRNKKQTNSDGE